MIKADTHIFQGMRRDNHPLLQDSKFLWDAHNIRITNRDDNTGYAITNERGNIKLDVDFIGTYIGHCVIGKYLVVFTSENAPDKDIDRIYRLEKSGNSFIKLLLFQGSLNLSITHPLETLGYYESKLIQKVYWVDGINQPRMINITKPELVIDEEDYDKYIVEDANFSEPIEGINNNFPLYRADSFDFNRKLNLQEDVTVTKIYGSGEFAQGVIQYALSYFDKYGQESNIFYTTPLYYISPKDRAGSPEEKVANAFNIVIDNIDIFDYVRIYSIHRTSIDTIPTVKIVADIATNIDDQLGKTISYTDTGTTGSTVDPAMLLYLGGDRVIANTLVQKDATLFLGNITQQTIDKGFKDAIKSEGYTIMDYSEAVVRPIAANSNYYDYTPSLERNKAWFKARETYRCGIQVQDSYGKWSEPIYVDDIVLNNNTPSDTRTSKSIVLNSTTVNNLRTLGAKKARTCIVFPRTIERDIICQGVLCPTVFSVDGRKNNGPYAMSSWFFRPAMNPDAVDNSNNIYRGASVEHRHNYPLFSANNRGGEIQSMDNENISYINDIAIPNDYKQYFFVDENIVTFHSPDIEFDTNLQNLVWDNVRLNIIGITQLGAISGDIDIMATATLSGSGFNHSFIGYPTNSNYNINGGLVSGLFYNGPIINNYNAASDKYWAVYPWQKSGSLNNDNTRPPEKGVRTSVLEKKVISNLKFFEDIIDLEEPLSYDITSPQLVTPQTGVVKCKPNYLDSEITYLGNIDTLLTSEKYPLYMSNVINGEYQEDFISDTERITSSDPIRMKYKSSPHVVFSLSDAQRDVINILPGAVGLYDSYSSNEPLPGWYIKGESEVSDIPVLEWYNIIGFGSAAFDDWDEKVEGRYVIDVFGDYLTLWRFDRSETDGKIHANRIYGDPTGIIIKASANITKVENEAKKRILPGTTKEQYSKIDGYDHRFTYIGEDKYYRIKSIKQTGLVHYIALEEVDNPIQPPTRSDGIYTVNRKSFSTLATPYLLVAELVRDQDINTKFGGKTPEALRQNLWVPSSIPIILKEDEAVTVPFMFGDTWYTRYDCMKTYPYTKEDENQVIEIGSFMCESRVNLDGRYDRNRGQQSNLNMSPQNFNLMNEIYSQKDNFFNYRKLEEDYYKLDSLVNTITWSLQKSSVADVDTWTKVNLASSLVLDGTKGAITKLSSFNELLLCFQDRALSQINFNSRVQLPTSDGVPIEIGNNFKVDGSRFFSDSIGCQNKWSVVQTPIGLFFIDAYTNSIWKFDGQLTNLSEGLGMTDWLLNYNLSQVWTPKTVLNSIGIRTFYDSKNQDVYFTPSKSKVLDSSALCYSIKLGQFVSTLDYQGTSAMFCINDNFYSLYMDGSQLSMWHNFVGHYNYIYEDWKPFYISFISNSDPLATKIFDTVEYNADMFKMSVAGQQMTNESFDTIIASNDYQEAYATLDSKNLRKKFRLWRALIPRAPKIDDKGNIRQYGNSRIRDTWTKITLGWNKRNNHKMVFNNVTVKYTV